MPGLGLSPTMSFREGWRHGQEEPGFVLTAIISAIVLAISVALGSLIGAI